MNVGVEIDMNKINEELQKDQSMTTEGPKAEQRDHDQHTREVLQRRLAEQLDSTDEQPERTEEEILNNDRQNQQARASMLRKIRLKKKPVEDRKERAAPLWMVRLFKTIGVLAVVLGVITVLAFVAWDNRDRYVQAWDKPGWHNKECIFKVGDRTVKGVREFSSKCLAAPRRSWPICRMVRDSSFRQATARKAATRLSVPIPIRFSWTTARMRLLSPTKKCAANAI